MKIEIVIHCYNYQRRLSWMLCSILQQKGDLPNIEVSVSYLPNNGNPTTEKVLDFFEEKGLKIIRVPLEKGQESNRAIPRSIRTEKTDADWLLFADCDLVYDPLFFDDWERFVYVSSSYYQILKDFTKEKGSIMSVMLALKCMGYKIEYR